MFSRLLEIRVLVERVSRRRRYAFRKFVKLSANAAPADAVGRGTQLLQLRVLGLGFFQDGDVGVNVFSESEEIVVRGEKSLGWTLCSIAQY